jgi:hypothetical protein
LPGGILLKFGNPWKEGMGSNREELYFPLIRGESETSVTRCKKSCIFKEIGGHKFVDLTVTGRDPKRDPGSSAVKLYGRDRV